MLKCFRDIFRFKMEGQWWDFLIISYIFVSTLFLQLNSFNCDYVYMILLKSKFPVCVNLILILMRHFGKYETNIQKQTDKVGEINTWKCISDGFLDFYASRIEKYIIVSENNENIDYSKQISQIHKIKRLLFVCFAVTVDFLKVVLIVRRVFSGTEIGRNKMASLKAPSKCIKEARRPNCFLLLKGIVNFLKGSNVSPTFEK